MQLSKKPLTAAEFIPLLAKIDPIYKEEEEAFKVCCVTFHTIVYLHCIRISNCIRALFMRVSAIAFNCFKYSDAPIHIKVQ